tara:strand:- start:4202 stop:4465 length:264 start_codon:yes stop_codon:yes gene_type:complete
VSKRKSNNNNFTKVISIILALVFTFSVGYVFFGIGKSFSEGDFNINSDQVWCANCQTYHDQATADQEKQKLTWCINCQKYHEPRDEK